MSDEEPGLLSQPIEAESQRMKDCAPDSVKGSDDCDFPCRKSRASNTARRVRFVARFIYWTYKHGSTKHAGWVCNYEGLWW